MGENQGKPEVKPGKPEGYRLDLRAWTEESLGGWSAQLHIPADGVKIPAAAQSLGSELVSVEMFIKPCSFKQGGGGGGSDERRRKASELRAELVGERSEDPTSRIRRRKVSEELSRHRASEEQAWNRRRKASELREEFARRAKDRNGRQDQRSSREKSQEVLTSSPSSPCLYRVLGLDNQANNKEIRKAFLGKVRECHPDRHTEAELGEQERMEA